MTLKYDKTKELLSKYTHEGGQLSDCPKNKETLPHIVTYGETEVPVRSVNDTSSLQVWNRMPRNTQSNTYDIIACVVFGIPKSCILGLD